MFVFIPSGFFMAQIVIWNGPKKYGFHWSVLGRGRRPEGPPMVLYGPL